MAPHKLQLCSIEAVARAVQDIKLGKATVRDYAEELALVSTTTFVSAILEAGRSASFYSQTSILTLVSSHLRLSIDAKGRPYNVVYTNEEPAVPLRLEPATFD